jgi:sulfatase maturation enzyme AslB (radical SAM superfamily)
MNDVTKVINEVHKLSAEEVGKVLDFINELQSRPLKPRSVDAVMRSFGSWKMTAQEYDQFMKDIADCRQ